MVQNTSFPTYESAEALRKQGKFQQAAQEYELLWKDSYAPSIGWRYAFCLRKLQQFERAESIAREALKKYPKDKYVVSEFGWVLYEKEIKPAIDENDLGKVLHTANEIWQYNPTDLLLNKLILAVMKIAKKRGKWEVVLEWSSRVNPDLLDITPFEFEGKRGMSDREIWYIGRSRAMYELEQFDQARHLAQKGLIEFPGELFLARTAALALAGSGDVGGGTTELRRLLNHPKADAYLKADLGELEFQLGNLKEAHRLLCEAVLNPQGEQYKLGYFVTLAKISLAEQQPIAAAESIALAKAIRQQEDWSIPTELSLVEQETRDLLSSQGLEWPDLPHDPRSLSKLCMEHWRIESTIGLKRVNGRVGKINPEKKHTFLHRDDREKPVFALLRDLPRGCKEGTKIDFALKPSFDRKKNEESVQAVDIKVIK